MSKKLRTFGDEPKLRFKDPADPFAYTPSEEKGSRPGDAFRHADSMRVNGQYPASGITPKKHPEPFKLTRHGKLNWWNPVYSKASGE